MHTVVATIGSKTLYCNHNSDWSGLVEVVLVDRNFDKEVVRFEVEGVLILEFAKGVVGPIIREKLEGLLDKMLYDT